MCLNMIRHFVFYSSRSNSQFKNILFKRNLGSSYVAEKLQGKGLIRISGDASSEFLQGLITNDMRYLDQHKPSLYCMFLNNKGRVLFDSIIYRTKEKDTFYLECDNKIINQLIKHLSLYKVRRKIDITPINNELSVWAIYNPKIIDKHVLSNEQTVKIESSSFDQNIIPDEDAVIAPDPRISVLGFRTIIKKDESLTCVPNGDLYDISRYKLGVGEGADELLIGQSFPLEMNCDYLNGVSFDKGCYIGQELTARTFHTGVTRKRMMPLIFDEEPDSIPLNTPIDDPDVTRKSPIGKVRAIKGRHGIGLMRISETLGAKSLKALNFGVRSFCPYWWNDPSQLRSVSA